MLTESKLRLRSANFHCTENNAPHRQFRHRRGHIFRTRPFFFRLKQIPTAQVNPSVSLRSAAPFTQGSLLLSFSIARFFWLSAMSDIWAVVKQARKRHMRQGVSERSQKPSVILSVSEGSRILWLRCPVHGILHRCAVQNDSGFAISIPRCRAVSRA